MARAGLDKNIIVRKTAQIANEIGVENVTLKMLADNLNIRTPSLYNHIKNLEGSMFLWNRSYGYVMRWI